jgi:ADP-heptose:LPS heptosyltransferase
MFIISKQVLPVLNYSKEFKKLHKFVKNKYCMSDKRLTLFESFADLATIRKNTHDYLLNMRGQYQN